MFTKASYVPNWSEKVFILKVKNVVLWAYVISDNGERLIATFY